MELSWSPVARFLENSFGWAMVLAAKKGVNLTVENNTNLITSIATFDSPPLFPSPDTSALMTRDLEIGGATTQTSSPPRQVLEDVYLHMDIYKIEQVIRNLVTNAVE